MKFSIAVPSLNYARFLEPCLESIRAQEGADLEVLVADGGSTDGSLAVARRFAAEDSRFRVVSTEDHGQADAVQRAFELSTGEVFGFLNADDRYLRSDAIATVERMFHEHPEADVVSGGGWYLDADGKPLKPVRLHRHPLDGWHMIRYRTAVIQPATFWRRRVQEVIPLRTDLHFAFDVWFFYDAFRRFSWHTAGDEIVGNRLHGANKSLGVRPARVRELAMFERHKWGAESARGTYLDVVGSMAEWSERLPYGQRLAKRALYVGVNTISYLTVFRLPSI